MKKADLEKVRVLLVESGALLNQAVNALAGVDTSEDDLNRDHVAAACLNLGHVRGNAEIMLKMLRKRPVLMDYALTKGQCRLRRKHGNPAEFAEAAFRAVPGDVSMAEARAAVLKYQQEWDAA
jgi:hypothetical protein